jgi:copper resistance protein B
MIRILSVFLVGSLWSGSVASAQVNPHAGHQPAAPTPSQATPPSELPPSIPPVTDEDRKAAFPQVEGHTVHDRSINYLVRLDQLEWQADSATSAVVLDTHGWIGADRDRLVFRAETESEGGHPERAHAHVLYGRQISRWWDLVAGIRQDVRPEPTQTWAAFGIQGLAPYWFEVEATAYVGASGRTEARLEVEYDLLFTNRLVIQPLAEVELAGKSDPERGVGAGLTSTSVGLRLRYEFRREFAPYAGVSWERKWGKTAELAEADGDATDGVRFVTGLRLWF